MANVYTNEIAAVGPAHEIDRLIAAFPRLDWVGDVAPSDSIPAGDGYPAGNVYVDVVVGSSRKPVFEDVETLSEGFPMLAFRIAAVELGNGKAEGRVFRNGEEETRYELPQEEIDEVMADNEDDADGPVLDAVASAIESVLHDAAVANARAYPASVVPVA